MNWFLKCLGNFANFKGRARRKEFWYFMLFSTIFGYVFMGLDNLFGFTFSIFDYTESINQYGQNPMPTMKYGPLYALYSLVLMIPGLAVAWRRMHDVGKNGWFYFVPIYGMFVLGCKNSEEGENQYGENPKLEAKTE